MTDIYDSDDPIPHHFVGHYEVMDRLEIMARDPQFSIADRAVFLAAATQLETSAVTNGLLETLTDQLAAAFEISHGHAWTQHFDNKQQRRIR